MMPLISCGFSSRVNRSCTRPASQLLSTKPARTLFVCAVALHSSLSYLCVLLPLPMNNRFMSATQLLRHTLRLGTRGSCSVTRDTKSHACPLCPRFVFARNINIQCTPLAYFLPSFRPCREIHLSLSLSLSLSHIQTSHATNKIDACLQDLQHNIRRSP